MESAKFAVGSGRKEKSRLGRDIDSTLWVYCARDSVDIAPMFLECM